MSHLILILCFVCKFKFYISSTLRTNFKDARVYCWKRFGCPNLSCNMFM